MIKMLISENKLRSIVRKILLEYPGAPDDLEDVAGKPKDIPDFSFIDDEDESDEWVSDNVTVDYKSMLDKAKNIAKKKLANSPIPANSLRKIVPALDNVKLVFVKMIKDAEGNPEKSAAAVHHVIIDTKTGKPTPEYPSKGLEFLDKASKRYFNIWKKRPFENPIILISQDSIKPLDQETMNHEFDHIKNNFIARVYPHVNLGEVKNILRKDLKGLSAGDIAEIFEKEGYYNKVESRNGASTIFDYYKSAMSKNPNHRLVDEIAVRVNEMMRQPGIQKIIDMINTKDKKLTYRYVMRVTKNENTAQVVPWLKKGNLKPSSLNKIVKSSDSKDKFTA